ncbi:helix-turn-helix domain-containing protein [Leifsonia sp. SIMBA_070]|uniref:helix-turn-helix domain-containing protein n=1 Tax=Leifsonia sp. SIMBA_070 TaxID=3085810 RepID=UPI00397A1EDF
MFREGGKTVVPDALAGYVLSLIMTNLGELRRRKLGYVRVELLELLDQLTVAQEAHTASSVNGTAVIDNDRIGVSAGGNLSPILPPAVLSVDRVADQLGCSTRHVTGLLHSGRLRGEKHGRQWIVMQSDLDNYMTGKAA